jgi:hypothetical protein
MLDHVRVGCACGAFRTLAIVAAVVAASTPASAGDAVHVRLRGASHIDAQGVRVDGNAMQLRGAVLDDADMPIDKGAVVVTFARAAAPT